MADPLPSSASGARDSLVGRVLSDRFKILSLIARGGMARVYRAEQLGVGRVCALKVLSAGPFGLRDPAFHGRFLREASLTSRLTHPNTVQVFDYGATDDDFYFIAMECLEGRTLQQTLREGGQLSESRSVRIALQICAALQQAHGIGVIHRDLKPANVFLVERDGQRDLVKVIDFGLVKDLSVHEEEPADTDTLTGSPRYMAPEQVTGRPVDARTDVYALGVVLYEMVTGKVPFDGPNAVAILMGHAKKPLRPVRDLNPMVSRSLEQIIGRCLEKAPEDRFHSMEEVITALDGLRALPSTPPGSPLSTENRTPPPEPQSWRPGTVRTPLAFAKILLGPSTNRG
jgi:serine/threonine-protein kinase